MLLSKLSAAKHDRPQPAGGVASQFLALGGPYGGNSEPSGRHS